MAGLPGSHRHYSLRQCLVGGLAATLVLLAGWLPLHPPEPPLPTADLYTHLSVARNLVDGNGFRTDITYPLSFAFPFARELPQPLIHRGPGFSLAMAPVYLAAGRDPAATVAGVRIFQVGILALIALTGVAVYLHQGRLFSTAPWLTFLASSSLLVYAVDWGFEELLCGWLLLLLWLRVRFRVVPGALDGLLAGALALIRLDLFWLPLLWWLWFGRERSLLARGKVEPAGPRRREILWAVAMLVLVLAPWAARNQLLTGQPFFSLQAQAELVKDTTAWPGYSVYRQLEPQPVTRVLARDMVPVGRKVARGLKFFATNLPRLLPLPYLLLSGLLVVLLLRATLARLPFLRGGNRIKPRSILAGESEFGPLAAATVTAVLLVGQYSFFDHNLRHLLPMVPVLLWEFSPLTGDLAVGVMERTLPSWPPRPHPVPVWIASAFITAAIIWVSWVPLDGWANARAQARSAAPRLADQVAAIGQDPSPVLFVPNSALPWYADRPAVWDPGNEETRAAIRELLEK